MTEPTKQKPAPKITRYQRYDIDHLSDAVACLAANIEDAFLMAGCQDYTAKECVEHAIALVSGGWKQSVVGQDFASDTT